MKVNPKKVSAGVLVWRRASVRDGLEVLIVHPGGPFFAGKDEGVWSIPKGLVFDDPGAVVVDIDDERLRETAIRELEEETGLVPETPMVSLGAITQKGGKVVHAFAMEADQELRPHRPPQVRIEWPPGSMRELAFDEVDEVRFVDLATARVKLNPAQVELLDRLVGVVDAPSA